MTRTKTKCACRKRPRRKCAWHALLDGTLTVIFVDGEKKKRAVTLPAFPSRRRSLRKGSTVEGNDTLPANSRRTARGTKRSRR